MKKQCWRHTVAIATYNPPRRTTTTATYNPPYAPPHALRLTTPLGEANSKEKQEKSIKNNAKAIQINKILLQPYENNGISTIGKKKH